ncbi:Polysaccharide biosynthesis [Ceratobasidium sp. AG-Ba]|nr:Polysaccharide biosynthesis [Ceratobasidium sp. AG-Ba]
MTTTTFNAETAENLIEIEKQFAVKAVEHAQTYWQLLEAVPPSRLKLTKFDDEIYNDFLEQFPEYNADHSAIRVIDEDAMKSKDNKLRWNKFMKSYEKKVQDHNFGSLIRRDANGDYDEQNTMFVPRMQFHVFEISRNRLGMNDHIYEAAQAKKKAS